MDLPCSAFIHPDGDVVIKVKLPDGRTLHIEADDEYIEAVVWEDDPQVVKPLKTYRED